MSWSLESASGALPLALFGHQTYCKTTRLETKMNTTKSDVLTVSDVNALSEIVSAASKSAKVAYVGIGDEIVYGTARHIVKSPDNIGFLRNDEDVRDGYLRVTLRSGFEAFPSVRFLMEAYGKGEFSIYDW